MQLSRKLSIIIIEVLAIAGVLVSLALVSIYYRGLPDRIPTHFTFSGMPDSYAGKESVWLLPIFGGLQYIMLSTITFFISMLKRPEEVTADLLVLIASMLRQLKLLFSLIGLYLVIGTFMIASGRASGLGAIFTPLFIILIVIVLVGNVVRIIRKQRTPQRG